MPKGAGRKKKKDVERYPSGQIIRKDDGAKELIAKKLACTLSTREDLTAIGVLSGRGIIDRDMKEAAIDFERCHRIAFGSSYIAPSTLERYDGTGEGDRWVRMIGTSPRMKMFIERLNDLGPTTFVMIRDLVLHSQSDGLIPLIITRDVIRHAPTNQHEIGALEARKGAITFDMRFRIGLITRALETLARCPKPKKKLSTGN